MIERLLECFRGKERAVPVLLGQAAENTEDRFAGNLRDLIRGLAVGKLGGEGAANRAGAASIGLKARLFHPVTFELKEHLYRIAACPGDTAVSFGIFHRSHVQRLEPPLKRDLAIHSPRLVKDLVLQALYEIIEFIVHRVFSLTLALHPLRP